MPAKVQDSTIEEHRPEIEQRTNDGDSCETIAAALRTQGYEVSSKTISRHRVAWGLRKRSAATQGRKYPNRKRTAHSTGNNRAKGQDERKADITARTLRGETAEQIAAALEAQGIELKAGVSTIWRLQTLWGLVEYDKGRARGKPNKVIKPRVGPLPKSRTLKAKRPNLAPSNPNQNLHYPTNCAHGPQKRVATNGIHDIDRGFLRSEIQIDSDAGSDSDNEPLPSFHNDVDTSAVRPADPVHGAPVRVATELMSAEFLVGLATSTLSAASRVKDLYLARQAQRPAPCSNSAFPPTDEDIAAAKKKVREAAAVMHDLAVPNAYATAAN